MKKFLLLFAVMFSFVGTKTALAQDDETKAIAINANTGDYTAWNNNPNSPWARGWASNETDPQVTISCGANNFAPWNGTDFRFFNCIGGNGTSYDYTFAVTSGWLFDSVSLDFFASNANSEVSVGIAGEQSETCNSTSQDDAVHMELEDISSSEFAFNVSANTPSRFAHTFNFVVTVRRLSAYETAMQELITVADEYYEYSDKGSKSFVVGSEPGNYGEEAVAAFNQAIEAAYNSEGKELTVDEIVALKQAILDAYDAVMATKAPLVLADGYYRFRTAINYNDGEKKYMFVNPDLSAKWGTIADLSNDCPSLFKITNTGGNYDIVSMSTDARFGAGGYANLSAESTELMVMTPVATIDDETYVQIHAVSLESGTIYIHQAGHSSGAGTGGNLTGWYATYPTTLENNMGASEWVIVAVDDAEAEAIIEAYEPIKNREKMIEDYKVMVATGTENLKIAKDITIELEGEGLITADEQFSSPFTCSESEENPANQGTDKLLDGNANTYWHSTWASSVPNHSHYLQVELTEPVDKPVSMVITRRPVVNDHITLWGVYGSNDDEADDEAWTEVASLVTPYGNNTETLTSEPFDTKGFKFLRFYIDNTSTGRGYGHVSEFQLYLADINDPATSQYHVMGATATDLEDVLAAQKDLEENEIQVEHYTALKTAYDAFMAKFVNPADLRSAIAVAEASTKGIVVGNNPGEWDASTDAGSLAQSVAAAKAYDEAGNYTEAQSQAYIEQLNSQAGDILASANTIQEGKWYRIHFGSKAVFEANEWDIENNEPTVSNGVQTNEALWDKYLTAAYLEQATETTYNDDGDEVNVTVNNVMPLEYDEDLVRGVRLFFDDDADISRRDLSLFRFINVGDSAYVLQNKGTGLFVRGENTTLDVIPSVFNVSAIGYGQNLIAAKNLISGSSQNYLHAQRAQNRLVTWSENTAGSRSALYIEEVEDVAGDYDGTQFQMNLVPGTVNTFCFPVNILVGDVEMYDVVGVEGNIVKLAEIKDEVAPGRPFIYINGETEYFNAENEAEPVVFRHGYDFTHEALEATFLKGTYSTIASLPKGALAAKDNAFVVSKSATMAMISVPAYTAFIQGSEEFELRDDYTYEITEQSDGIEATLKSVAKRGKLYSIDGRLLNRNANLNDLKHYGRGVYIINGTKVVVK